MSPKYLSENGWIEKQAVGAFYGYRSAALDILGAGDRILQCDAELYDVSGWLDTSTNKGRYTPQLAGYYRVSSTVQLTSGSTYYAIDLFKNGAIYSSLGMNGSSPSLPRPGGSALVKMNGTTDYIEISVYHSSAGVNRAIGTGSAFAYFCGEFVGSD